MTQDGHVDYTRMTRAQLEEALTRIDRNAYPVNFSRLVAELETRGDERPSYERPLTLADALRGSPPPRLEDRERGLQVSARLPKALRFAALVVPVGIAVGVSLVAAFRPDLMIVDGAPASAAGRIGAAAFVWLFCGAVAWFGLRFVAAVTLVSDGVRVDGWRGSILISDDRVWEVEWIQTPSVNYSGTARLWLTDDSLLGEEIRFFPRSPAHLAVLAQLRRRDFRPSTWFAGTPVAE